MGLVIRRVIAWMLVPGYRRERYSSPTQRMHKESGEGGGSPNLNTYTTTYTPQATPSCLPLLESASSPTSSAPPTSPLPMHPPCPSPLAQCLPAAQSYSRSPSPRSARLARVVRDAAPLEAEHLEDDTAMSLIMACQIACLAASQDNHIGDAEKSRRHALLGGRTKRRGNCGGGPGRRRTLFA